MDLRKKKTNEKKVEPFLFVRGGMVGGLSWLFGSLVELGRDSRRRSWCAGERLTYG